MSHEPCRSACLPANLNFASFYDPEQPCATCAELQAEQTKSDQRLITLCRTLDDATLQGTVVFRKGQPVPIDAEKVSASLNASEVRIDLACRLGKSEATCWTCDLSKEYVTINADYHT